MSEFGDDSRFRGDSRFRNQGEAPEEMIADLRRAWHDLDAAPSLRSIDAEDQTTRAMVQWMRAAYSCMEPQALASQRTPPRSTCYVWR